MNNKCKAENKGVTLIALIITVIVLLILAGTAISISVNGGDLFGKAQNAVTQYNAKVTEEEQKINEVWDILNSIQSGNTVITSTPEPGPTTSVGGQIIWGDNNGQGRPASVEVVLKRNGTEYQTKMVTGTGYTWQFSFDNVPEQDAEENAYTYTVEQKTTVAGYETDVHTITNRASFPLSMYSYTTISNSLIPVLSNGKINIYGTIGWMEHDADFGTRPSSVSVLLYQNGTNIATVTTTEAQGWHYSFENIDQNGDEAVRTDGVLRFYNIAKAYNTLIIELIQGPQTTPPGAPPAP